MKISNANFDSQDRPVHETEQVYDIAHDVAGILGVAYDHSDISEVNMKFSKNGAFVQVKQTTSKFFSRRIS